ncbi:DUF6266 family protein [Sinomicrobium weinanense]|uniref:Uncharacterized protein n=1 Tax=Sinomicrobium weinanense TaxID=2842200 RepID=A0A926JSN9_9FLAO|nr:DUF6266 family protein [Sinomicrobium weinanense]MBC9796790.1 hypothetical protein [Sinomicrobium weinanense]MBU3125523.1 hypothetical protein [Sinomicrobium weinanense]
MAIISKGILGGFSGKVGTVVGANWRGKDIIRSTPKPSSKEPTNKQLLQQMKFKLVVGFLQPVRSIQQLFFGTRSGARSRINLAVSYTINEAVEVVNDMPQLVYNKVLITRGDLAGFQNAALNNQAGGVLTLSWEDNSIQGNASATDLVNLVCYCPETETFESFLQLAKRTDLTATVTVPELFTGKEVQVWAYFNNEMQTKACNSPYLGAFTIA